MQINNLLIGGGVGAALVFLKMNGESLFYVMAGAAIVYLILRMVFKV